MTQEERKRMERGKDMKGETDEGKKGLGGKQLKERCGKAKGKKVGSIECTEKQKEAKRLGRGKDMKGETEEGEKGLGGKQLKEEYERARGGGLGGGGGLG